MIDRIRPVPRALKIAIASVVTVWSVVLVGGLAGFSIDQNRPGTRGTIPARWPAEILGLYIVLLFATPVFLWLLQKGKTGWLLAVSWRSSRGFAGDGPQLTGAVFFLRTRQT